MPPSAMTGMPAGPHARAAAMMAVICGTPTPATTRVVQMDPGPTPTFTASAPASTIARAPSYVATLPPTTSQSRSSRLSSATMSRTAREWPCAVSTMRTSTPASARLRARLYPSSPTPTAAATRSRPASSLVALGYCSLLAKSLTVMSPRSLPASSTIGSFSTLCRRSRASASALPTPTGAVTSGIGVMISRTGVAGSVTNRMSRLVTMPTSAPVASVTGTPEMR